MRMVGDGAACGFTGSPVQRPEQAGPNLMTCDFIDQEPARKRDYTTEFRTSRVAGRSQRRAPFHRRIILLPCGMLRTLVLKLPLVPTLERSAVACAGDT